MKYKVVLTIETKSNPIVFMDFIKARIKDVLPVLSLNYHVIEDRETTVEHHGGNQDEN